MPNWYYSLEELKNSPSCKKGMPFSVELQNRQLASKFIFELGSKMDVSTASNSTAIVYFHRFYMFHSFQKFDKIVTATSCLFLAGKVEETPKKCRDILRAVKELIQENEWSAFEPDPRDKVMTLESIILQTIKFDLQVDNPYTFLVKFAKMLVAEKTRVEKIVEMAWTFINDSLSTTLCIEIEPDIVAMSMLYLSCRFTKFVPDRIKYKGTVHSVTAEWWKALIPDVEKKVIEGICHKVLDIYGEVGKAKA